MSSRETVPRRGDPIASGGFNVADRLRCARSLLIPRHLVMSVDRTAVRIERVKGRNAEVPPCWVYDP